MLVITIGSGSTLNYTKKNDAFSTPSNLHLSNGVKAAVSVSTPAEGEAWSRKKVWNVESVECSNGKWVGLSANGYPVAKLT